jgi:hypothetical protein
MVCGSYLAVMHILRYASLKTGLINKHSTLKGYAQMFYRHANTKETVIRQFQ